MAGAKVVGIHGGADHVAAGRAKPLPVPLVKLREACKQRLQSLLRTMFESADDALFAMADKAENNSDQSMYFDAMRELRLQKKHIATTVVKGLIRSFNELGHYRAQSQTPQGVGTDLDELSLIQNDELEIRVAVDGMINRVRGTSKVSLEELQVRVQSLLTGLTIEADQVPSSPELLCESFIEGCDELDIAIRARLVVLKLFEKFVLSELAAVYVDANQLLIKQGVLPEIKTAMTGRVPRKNVTNPSAAMPGELPSGTIDNPGAAHPTYMGSLAGSIEGQFEGLRQLLHQGQGNRYMSSIEPPTLSEAYYSQDELVGALSMFQGERVEQLSSHGHGQVIDFAALLNQRLAQGDTQANYSEMDADVINLVSMLFEFILEDRQLQPEMKALIARLQIPILKIAILDRSFFNKGGHPARKLLNEIAQAAIGWNAPKKDGKDRLKDKIENIVIRITEDFDQDISLFNELLQGFTQFVDVERRRGELVEQRTKDSEKGKAASDAAKLAAQEKLNVSLKGHTIPDFLVTLLRDGWSSVMVLHYLKEGPEGSHWLDACTLVDELIWSIHPDESGADARSKLLKLIPGLMKRLHAGLKEVSFDEFKAKDLIKQLEELHVNALKSLQGINDAPAEADIEVGRDAFDGDMSASIEETMAEQDDAVADLIRSTMELEHDFNQSQAAETVEESFEASAEQEEIVLLSVEPEKVEAQIDESDPFVQQVEKFAVGCWFEFQDDSKPERCKLAAVIKATGKYIFVNRSGVKVAEKSKMGLAVELRRGSVQILNDGLLFDRALESIITNLRGKDKNA